MRIIFTLLTFLPYYILAQSNMAIAPQVPLNQLVVDNWTSDQGLISNNLTSVRQTKDGYLWITSYNGIIRFDGYKFQLFDKSNLDNLASNAFYDTFESKDSTLWFATQGSKIITYKKDSFRSPTGIKDLPKSIRKVNIDASGYQWVGTNSKGVYVNTGDGFEPWKANVLSEISVFDIEFGSTSEVYVATFGEGLLTYINDQLKFYRTEDGMYSDLISCLLIDNQQNLYVGTTEGLNLFKDGELFKIAATEGFSINNIVQDEFGAIWLSMEVGLMRLYGDQIELLTEADGLPSRQISDLCFDHEGSLWLTTKKSGLVRLKKGNVLNIGVDDGLASRNTNIIYEHKGKIYVGADEGQIDIIENKQVRGYDLKTSMEGKGIRDMYVDKNGTMWIASYLGLLRKTGNSEKLITTKDGLSSHHIRRMYFDESGRKIWMSTRTGGVNIYDLNTKKIKVIDKSNGLNTNYIFCVEKNSDGDMYVGTHGGGIGIIDSDFNITNKKIYEDSSGVLIFNIHIDNENNCWLATNIGVFLYEDEEFKKLALKDYANLETIFDIEEDDIGNLWLSSNIGIVQLDKRKALNHLRNGSGEFSIIKLYNESDGMVKKECTGATKMLKSSDGNIWVPTLGGVVKIEPGNIVFNDIPPNVYVSNFRTDVPPKNLEKNSISPDNINYFIEFTSLSFYAPEKGKFLYMLEGFDKEWTETMSERQVKYTNLPAGQYTFKVKATNNDNVWSEEEAGFQFEVLPHFYETWYFYFIVFSMILLLFLLIYNQRVKTINRRNRELQKLNDELDRFVYSASHDLRAPLASVQGLVSIAVKENGEDSKNQYLNMINSLISKLDGFTREITDYSRNARNDLSIEKVDLEKIFLEVVNDLRYLDENDKIKKLIEVEQTDEFHSDERRLKVIFHNLISNAINYHNTLKKNPYIRLVAKIENEKAELVVEDNGLGIEKKHHHKIFDMFYRASEGSKGSGLGLYIVMETLNKLGGKIKVESEHQNGTRFTIRLMDGRKVMRRRNGIRKYFLIQNY